MTNQIHPQKQGGVNGQFTYYNYNYNYFDQSNSSTITGWSQLGGDFYNKLYHQSWAD